jgi:hypothetical protein
MPSSLVMRIRMGLRFVAWEGEVGEEAIEGAGPPDK